MGARSCACLRWPALSLLPTTTSRAPRLRQQPPLSPSTNDQKKLTMTVREKPAERVSKGWISEGTSQPRGPHDLGVRRRAVG